MLSSPAFPIVIARTDLGFTRDRQLKLSKSAKADLGGGRSRKQDVDGRAFSAKTRFRPAMTLSETPASLSPSWPDLFRPSTSRLLCFL